MAFGLRLRILVLGILPFWDFEFLLFVCFCVFCVFKFEFVFGSGFVLLRSCDNV